MLTLLPLAADRVVPCLADLAPADRAELQAAGLADSVQQLVDALPTCTWAMEARWHGRAVAIFGVRPMPGSTAGIPWMLTMTGMAQADRAPIARAAVRAVRRMQAEFPRLVNWVHAENERAVRFVAWLGFRVERMPAGPGGRFWIFEWRRDV